MGHVKLKDKLMSTPTSIRLTERQVEFCNKQSDVSAHVRKLIDKDMRYAELIEKMFTAYGNKEAKMAID